MGQDGQLLGLAVFERFFQAALEVEEKLVRLFHQHQPRDAIDIDSLGEGEVPLNFHVLPVLQRQSRVDAPLFDGLPVTVQRLQGVILDPGWHGLYRPQPEGDDEDVIDIPLPLRLGDDRRGEIQVFHRDARHAGRQENTLRQGVVTRLFGGPGLQFPNDQWVHRQRGWLPAAEILVPPGHHARVESLGIIAYQCLGAIALRQGPVGLHRAVQFHRQLTEALAGAVGVEHGL